MADFIVQWLNRQAGLSLLEVMMALGLLGVAGIALIVSLNGAFQAQDISRERVLAENLARVQLEYIREQTYFPSPNPTPSVPYLIPPGDAPGAYTVPPPGVAVPQGYEIIVTVTQYCDGTGEPAFVPCYNPADIQKNTVRVSREGKGLITVEDLRTRR